MHGRVTSPRRRATSWLHFSAGDVPLEEELRDALRPAMRQVWNVLQPRGIIDLTADMRYLDQAHAARPERARRAAQRNRLDRAGSFPYRLEKLQGVVQAYRNGRVTLEHFKAEHGPVKVAAGGYCNFLPDGGWHLHLEGLTVDRLRVDRELMQAVPARLKQGAGAS